MYDIGKALGYLATFTMKSLIKEAIIRESHGLEFDEETMKIVEKISEDLFSG